MTSTSDSLVFERDYQAALDRLFLAWTRVDLLQRWFGCAKDRLWQIHEWDVRAGGRLHVSLDFDGKPFEAHGEFLVVEPPSRLTYRWSTDELVDVQIEPRASGSRLKLTHTFRRRPQARGILTMGWSASLAQLSDA